MPLFSCLSWSGPREKIPSLSHALKFSKLPWSPERLSVLSTESPMSSQRLLALTKVKILTQTSLEPIKLDQQIILDHLLVKFVFLGNKRTVYTEAGNIVLPSSNIQRLEDHSAVSKNLSNGNSRQQEKLETAVDTLEFRSLPVNFHT